MREDEVEIKRLKLYSVFVNWSVYFHLLLLLFLNKSQNLQTKTIFDVQLYFRLFLLVWNLSFKIKIGRSFLGNSTESLMEETSQKKWWGWGLDSITCGDGDTSEYDITSKDK